MAPQRIRIGIRRGGVTHSVNPSHYLITLIKYSFAGSSEHASPVHRGGGYSDIGKVASDNEIEKWQKNSVNFRQRVSQGGGERQKEREREEEETRGRGRGREREQEGGKERELRLC